MNSNSDRLSQTQFEHRFSSGEWAKLSSEQWLRSGEFDALNCFQEAARRVPAYRHFLKNQGFSPNDVLSMADWDHIPITNKENYLSQYSLEDLAWDGTLISAACIHSSSGSTGQPQYWPCSMRELERASKYYATVLKEGLLADKRSTLLMICFGMGTWIAGSYTVASALLLQRDGLNITTVTPGFNRAEALRILQDVAVKFEQVVIAGIRSFIKDLVDAWHASEPANKPIFHCLLAGEPFPEPWRSYIKSFHSAGKTQAISILGSADAVLIGFESNWTIQLRQALSSCNVAYRYALLDSERVPSTFHYDPTHRYI